MNRLGKKEFWLPVAIILAIVVFFLSKLIFYKDHVYEKVNASTIDLKNEFSLNTLPPYITVENDYQKHNLPLLGEQAISIEAADYKNASDDVESSIKPNTDKGKNVLDWANEKGWVEWEVLVPEQGLYNLEVEYTSVQGGFSSVIRGIQVDGKYPFQEAETVAFPRIWKDSKFPYDRNIIGQEVRPRQLEIAGWKVLRVSDFSASSEPLLWHFTAGKHTIRFVGVKEAISLASIKVVSPVKIPAYASYAKQYSLSNKSNHWFHIIEAERFLQKSDTAIQTKPFSQAHISPEPKGRVVYNTLGGDRWKTPGDWVEWEVQVPEDGIYHIDLKFLQLFQGRTNMYRTIMIDGAVPFKEMLHYMLPWNKNFRIMPLQDKQGTPYRFYLTKGTHILRMISDATPVEPAVVALHNSIRELNLFTQSIRKITGNYGGGSYASTVNFDLNRTWDLKTYIPDIENKLQKMIDNFQHIADYLNGLNGNKNDTTTSIAIAVDTLQRFQTNVNKIPNQINDFDTMQTSMAAWLAKVPEQPVMMDFIVVRAPDAITDLKEPTSLNESIYAAVNLFRSFYLQYDMRSLNKEDAVTVWINRGRDYVNLLQEKIAQDFTAETGIEVNLNQMPNPNQLILGNAAGEQPDVALGITYEMPTDFAMRDAVVDLSKFADFKEVFNRFSPGVMRSLQYNGGTYALPELQYFSMLFYRTDIFDQLGLQPPDTWEDVLTMLPTLQENGMTFYYPKDFFPMLFQNGAEVYHSDGLHTELGDKKSMDAFKMYTDLFIKYDTPLDVPSFFNHFKNGDIPVGISDYNTYIQLSAAAPEIKGRWKMAVFPGIRQPDGTIARWMQQVTYNGMIMKKSKKQEQAWQFLKWWTSTEVQTRYGLDMESFYGSEYRWNSANLQAFAAMPWSKQELNVIEEQGKWVKNLPFVPGYYFLSRELDFAWNRAVVGLKMPAKEALEKAAISLQREMDRKQRDLGIPNDANLQIPQIDHPYDWRSP